MVSDGFVVDEMTTKICERPANEVASVLVPVHVIMNESPTLRLIDVFELNNEPR